MRREHQRGERAKVIESTMPRERAKLRESTNGTERAMTDERTIVTEKESTTNSERQDWKGFDFDSIRKEAMEMYDEHNLHGVRIAPVMAQDSLDYWIAVAAWTRAKE